MNNTLQISLFPCPKRGGDIAKQVLRSLLLNPLGLGNQ